MLPIIANWYKSVLKFFRELHKAIAEGHFQLASFLICLTPHASFLDLANDDGETALHIAVLARQPRLTRLLVFAGASPSAVNWQGDTALHLACQAGDLYCVRALTQPFEPSEKPRLHHAASAKSVSDALPQNLEQPNNDGEQMSVKPTHFLFIFAAVLAVARVRLEPQSEYSRIGN